MAQIRWYLNNSLLDGWQLVDQSAAAAATCNCGWVVGTGSTFSSELQANTERASTTFVANTVPDGTLDTTLKDAFRSQFPWTGTFAAGNWAFQFAVVSTVQSGAADGQIVFRILKANADGSGATEITTAQQSTTIATNVAGTDVNITATWAAPAWTITNQYIFVQVAWKRTGAGGMTTTNIRLRTGSSTTVGTTGLTADFTPGTQTVTGATIASGASLQSAHTVFGDRLVTGTTLASTVALFSGTAAFPAAGGTIVFDNAVDFAYDSAIPFTRSYAVGSDADRILLLGFESNGGDDITACTFDGVALTKIGFYGDGSGGGVSAWYQLAPNSGTHTVSVTRSGSGNANLMVASYSGVEQTAPDNAVSYLGGGGFGFYITPGHDNDWIVVFASSRSEGELYAGVNVIHDYSGSSTYSFVGDTGVITPAVPTNVAVLPGDASQVTWAISIAPAAPSAPPDQSVSGTFIGGAATVFAGTVSVGGATTQSVTGAFIGGDFDVLLEDGSFLLLEDGSSHLLYEPSTMGTSQVFAGTVDQAAGAQSVSGATLASSQQLFAGTVAPGAVTLLGATLGSSQQLFAGTITTLTSITGATRASTAVVTAGSVLTVTSVSGAIISSTAQLFSGVVTTTTFVTGATLPAGATVFPGRVSALVGGATVSSTATLFPGAIAVNVLGAHRASTTTLFPGSLSPVGATLGPSAQVFPGTALLVGVLAGATVPSTATLFPGAITTGAVTITGATIASGAAVFSGSVTTLTSITGATRPSTTTVFPGSITTGAVTVGGSTLAASATVFPGTVSPGAVTVLGATVSSTATPFPGTVSPGAVLVSGALVPSSAIVFPGTVAAGAVFLVSGAHVASTTTLFPGRVFTGIPVTGAIILSGSTLTPGLVTPGPVTITGATLTAPDPATHVFPGHVATATVICAVEFPIDTDALGSGSWGPGEAA